MVRKTSQWYAAECVHARCVCLAASVCVSERLEEERGEAKETAKEEEKDEEGVSIGGHRGDGELRLTGPARTHHLRQLVTHLLLTQYITLHFWCLKNGKEINVNITAAAMAFNQKRRYPLLRMCLAIPSSPSRLCYWSLCSDLPKDPDFLATACHQTFGRSSTFSLFVRNGSAASLLCVCHQPCCCYRRRCCCWMSQTGCKSPLIILFSSNHTT